MLFKVPKNTNNLKRVQPTNQALWMSPFPPQTGSESGRSAWPRLRGGGPPVPDRPPVHQHWHHSVGAAQAREGGSQRRSISREREELPESSARVEHGQHVSFHMDGWVWRLAHTANTDPFNVIQRYLLILNCDSYTGSISWQYLLYLL